MPARELQEQLNKLREQIADFGVRDGLLLPFGRGDLSSTQPSFGLDIRNGKSAAESNRQQRGGDGESSPILGIRDTR